MAQVEKIYSLKTLGFDQIMAELDALSKKFVEIKKAKQEAAKTAADTAKNVGIESEAYKAAAKALEEVKIKELELAKAIKEKTNEAKAGQLARQEDINAQKAAINGNTAETESLTNVGKARTALNKAIKDVNPGNPVNFNGLVLPYEQANAVLLKLTQQSQAYVRQFQKDGTLVGEYTSGIIQAFKRMGIDDLVVGQVTRSNDQLKQLNAEFDILKQELRSVQESGKGSFTDLEKQLLANRNAAALLEKEVGRLQTELRGTGDIGNQITTGLANGFKEMKGQLSGFLMSYVGFQAAFQGIMSGIDTAKELSDQTTSLEVEFGKAAGGMDKFTSALAKLNTRTPLTELENIANIAAKAGVSEENLVGVSQAIDKIKIAFGKDFGDVEAGTESLVKLVNIFEGTANVTGDNLLKTGNAIRTLANETVASVPFLNDFAKRMAGLKGISDISLPAVLGLGSGFEQFGQSAEVAGTTLTRVIPKLASDTAKYAKIAGLTQQAFADLLKDNPAEALIKVSEGLVKGKANIEEISKAFADSQLGSGRVAAILGTVGSKADDFRKAIKSAGNAFNDTSNIETAFTAKNENLAATLDKISKSFLDAANSTAFRVTLTAIAGLISLLIGHLGIIIGTLGVFATAWTIANAAMIGAKIEATALAISTTFLNAATVIGATFTRAYAVAMGFLSSATGIAATETGILATALRFLAGPIGIILTVLGLMVVAYKASAEGMSNMSSSLQSLIKQQQNYRDSLSQARSDIADQMAKETTLIAILNSHTTAEETKTRALKDLIAINPEYLHGLTLQNVTLKEGKDILDAYNNSLLLKAQRQAADAIKTKEFNDLINAQRIKYELEQKKAAIDTGTTVGFADLTDEQRSFFPTGVGSKNASYGLSKFFNEKVFTDEINAALKTVNDVIKKKEVDVNAAEKNAVDVAEKSTLADKAILVTQETQINTRITLMRENLQKMRDASQQDTEGYKKLNAELNVSLAQRDQVRDKILGLKSPTAKLAEGNKDVDVEELKRQLTDVNKQIAAIDSIKNKTAEELSKLRLLRAQRTELRKEIVEKGGSIKATNPNKTDTDALSIIDSELKAALTEQETKIINLQKIDSEIVGEASKTRKLTTQEEIQNITDTAVINTKYLNQKIDYLKSRGTLDAKEKEQLAGFIKEKADIQLQSITKIQEINNREFSERQTGLRNQLDQEIAAIKEADNVVQADPTATNTVKAQSKLNADNQILDLYKRFNTQVDILEKQLGVTSVKNSREIVNQINALNKDKVAAQKDLTVAALKDVQATGDRLISEFKATMASARLAIQNNNSLTPEKKNTALAEIDRQENLGIIAREVASEKSQLPIYENLLKTKQITDKEYNDFITKMRTDQSKLLDSTTTDLQVNVIKVTDISSFITKKVRSLFSFDTVNAGDDKATVDKKVALQELFAQTVSETFNLAKTAMDDYYNAEQQQIERSRSNKEKQLQFELDQAKANAQSQAEKDSLDKQFAAKKDANDRAAFEKNKQVQKQQALVNLAIQLSNIAVVSTAPGPANLLTVGVFGQVMYALQTVMALASYAMNVKRIDSAQFAEGGTIPSRGGVIKGRTHASGGVKFNYEAEDEEMSIIRTRNAPRNKIFQVTGTLHQIASQTNVLGGGVSFAPGAKVKRFDLGGNISKTLSAPVFVPSNSNNTVSQNNNADIIAALNVQNQSIQQLAAETSKRFERIEVVQVTSSVTRAQQKQVQQKAIGTL